MPSITEVSKSLADHGQTLKEWSTAVVRPLARAADEQHAPPANWKDIVASCPVPLSSQSEEKAPYNDGYWVGRGVEYENIAYGDVWLQPLLGGGLGCVVVDSMGTEAQVERWGTKSVARNGWMSSFALTEPGFGSDTSRVSTTATQDGDSWVLKGNKIYCSAGADSDYVTVFATLDKNLGPTGITAFVVPIDTPGLIIAKANEDKLGLRSWVTSELLFDDCRVPLDHRLGSDSNGTLHERRSGRSGALGALSFNRPSMSAFAIGVAQAALDTTTELLLESRTGFAPHRWRTIEDEIATMNVSLERGRRTVYRAQRLVDAGNPDNAAAATAKAYAPRTCERLVRRCMQLLGPDGASTELLLEKWYRDLKIFDIFEGSGEIQRIVVGRKLMGRLVS